MAASSSSSSSKRRVCLLDHLNEHILAKVLDKLSDPFDRRSFRLVCKLFLEVEVSSRRRLQLLRAELLERLLERFKNLREVDLSLCTGITDQKLMSLVDVAGSYISAVLLNRAVGDFGNAGLSYLTSVCTALVELDVSYCPKIGDEGVDGLARSNRLEKLRLTGLFRVSDIGLQHVASGCHRLQELVLKGCVGFTDAGLQRVVASGKELTLLDLSFTMITDEGVGHAASLKNLRILKLTSCNNVGDKGLEYLSVECKSLLELDVSRCQNIRFVGIAASLPLLRHLNFSQCPQVTEEALLPFKVLNNLQCVKLDAIELREDGLDHIAEGCKQLQELSLSKSRGLTDGRIASVLASCKSLRKLDLTCCVDLTEATLRSIAASCMGITTLKMESALMVTDATLRLLFESCSLLEELDITDCNVTDAGLMSVGNCKLLRILKLAFCNTSNAGITYVGTFCKNLTELDLYRCRGIGDVGVVSVATGCQSLRVLNLSYCSRITDVSMSSIARLSYLCQLEIRGCRLVTSNGLAEVAAGCKRLVELDIKRCSNIDDNGVVALQQLCPGLRQINVSYCPLTNNGLMALSNLSCMQNMKLLHLKYVTQDCLAHALLNCASLKKVKLLSQIKHDFDRSTKAQLKYRGCRLRWMDKQPRTSD